MGWQPFYKKEKNMNIIKKERKNLLMSLPALTRTMAGKFNVEIKFENVSTAMCTASTITFPSRILLEEDPKVLMMARAFSHHEGAHIRFNDHDLPSSPNALYHEVLNSIMDLRLERWVQEEYPGTALHFKELDRVFIEEEKFCKATPDESILTSAMKYLCHQGYGSLTDRMDLFEDLIKEDIKVLNKNAPGLKRLIDPFFAKIALIPDKDECARLAKDFVQILRKYAKDLKQQAQQQSSSSSSENEEQDNQENDSNQSSDNPDANSNKSDESEMSDSDENSGNSETGSDMDEESEGSEESSGSNENSKSETDCNSGTGSDEDSGSKDESDGDEGSSGGSGPENDSVDGSGKDEADSPGNSRDNSSNQGESGSTGNSNSTCSGEIGGNGAGKNSDTGQELEEKANEILQEIKEGTGLKDTAQMIQEELGKFDSCDENTTSAPSKLIEFPIRNKAQGMSDAVMQIKSKTSSLSNRLRIYLESKDYQRLYTGKRGKRVDGRRINRIITNDLRVFEKKLEKRAINTAVQLVLDVSTSMNGRKILKAKECCLGLALALENIKSLSFSTIAFPALDDDSKAWLVQDFNESLNLKTKLKYLSIYGNGTTPLDSALMQAGLRLFQRPEKRKIIFVLTDGHPNSPDPTIEVIKKLQENGIELYGVGIFTDAVKLFFPANKHGVISTLEDLAPTIFKMLKHAL